jgi:soluble lytic murein transglycosylase
VVTARTRGSSGWSGWFWALAAGAGLVALVALITRFDFGDALDEVTLPLKHDDIIRQEAGDEDVASVNGEAISLPTTDPALLAAVIYTESRFRDQTSEAGARGLMQITPDTADTIEKLSGGETFVFEDLADPDLNIRYGSFYLRYLLHKYGGNEEAALAAYNAGEGNADAWGGSDLEIDDIEFPETREYVENVLERRDGYRDKHGDELGL